MKTKLLLTPLFLFAVNILMTAQTIPDDWECGGTGTYRSYFGNEFTHWYTYHTFYDVSYSELYSVEKDTILSNEVNYKRLCTVYRDMVNYLWGIREETETGSLFINKDGNKEILVSRMDLEIGDKFYFSSDMINEAWNSYYYFDNILTDENGNYTIVDSIYYEDNRKHIRFEAMYHAFYNDIQLTFIEGIGPNISFEPIVGGFWMGIGFNCYETENGLWKSKNLPSGLNGECLFNFSSIPQIKTEFPLQLIQRKGEIELQPDAGDFVSGWVYVYSIEGKLLYSQPVKRSTDIIIPTSGFSNGTHVIQLKERQTQRTWSRKIILRF